MGIQSKKKKKKKKKKACIGNVLTYLKILCKRFMEKDNFLFKMFQTLTLNQFYRMVHITYLKCTTKNLLLTFIYILIIHKFQRGTPVKKWVKLPVRWRK